MLTMTFSPMSIRPSIVAEPMCGSSTTLSRPSSFGIDRGLVLEHVQPGAGDLAVGQHPGQRILVDHLAARRVDHDGVGLEQLEAARRQQVIGRRRVRAVDRQDVHMGEHLVEALPERGLEFALGRRVEAPTVVVVHRQAEAPGAARQRPADPAHAQDAEALAPDPVAEHGRRAPALPFARAHQPLALGDPARYGEDQRHRHVRRVLGQHAGRVGHRDAAFARRGEVDMVDAGAEGGDQAQPRAGLGHDALVDPVGHGRHQHVGHLAGLDQLGARHRLVVAVQARVEQFHHAGLDGVRQLAGHDDDRLFLRHGAPRFIRRGESGCASAAGVCGYQGAMAMSSVQRPAA